MNTLCLLANAKQVSPERVSAKITSAPYNCSSCYSLDAASFAVNMTVAYRGTTTSLISKVIHHQTQLKAHFFLKHPKILQTDIIFKRPCPPCCIMTSGTFFHVYMIGYSHCSLYHVSHIYVLYFLSPPIYPCWLKMQSRGELGGGKGQAIPQTTLSQTRSHFGRREQRGQTLCLLNTSGCCPQRYFWEPTGIVTQWIYFTGSWAEFISCAEIPA